MSWESLHNEPAQRIITRLPRCRAMLTQNLARVPRVLPRLSSFFNHFIRPITHFQVFLVSCPAYHDPLDWLNKIGQPYEGTFLGGASNLVASEKTGANEQHHNSKEVYTKADVASHNVSLLSAIFIKQGRKIFLSN